MPLSGFYSQVYSQGCATIPTIISEHFLNTSKRKAYPLAVILHLPSHPAIFLSLYICLSWTFHISGIILGWPKSSFGCFMESLDWTFGPTQYNVWPFVSACFHLACSQDSSMLSSISIHSLMWLSNTPFYGDTTFCLSIYQLMDFRLFPHFGYYE